LEKAVRHPSSPDRHAKLEEDIRANELLGFIDPRIQRVYRSIGARSELRREVGGLNTLRE
jgi:hypothetical protein